MCTVSFVASGNRYYLTSNRDEHRARPAALVPKEEWINNCKVVYPKDPKAGGTWFAVNENGDVAVLLNGAFQKHIVKGNYEKSRGLVLLDIISSPQPLSKLHEIDVSCIEPFTVILFGGGELVEFRWDGIQKHFKSLPLSKNHIWSSATLYSSEAMAHREDLFHLFQQKKQTIKGEDILEFHATNHEDYENGFVIDRSTGLKTFSVTQAIVGSDAIKLHHVDLLNATKHSLSLRPKVTLITP
ncbi:NRDE family protein [Arenibacter sp. GZD96]|uniref:NRDE family protein n=1 Tax=Aurantibrevibacter litoralis TaxID=3106030 RepID=UPI002B000799|nr:NRDE family protein [Arenibacter sp. GZD-96]MEA1786745.1 NRDE family protein [Arenibacter sp. GZD-96]